MKKGTATKTLARNVIEGFLIGSGAVFWTYIIIGAIREDKEK